MRDLSPLELARTAAALVTQWPAMRSRPGWSLERIRQYQLAGLQSVISYACEHVPFYRDKYARAGVGPSDLRSLEDLQLFPVTTKDEVIANYPARMIADGFSLDDLIVSRSSGSSGQVLDIAYDGKAMTTYILAGFRLYGMGFQYRPWHRQLYIYTSPYPLDSLLGMFPMKFVSTLAPPQEILAQIRAYKPHLLVCYPSHLRQLLDEARSTSQLQLPRPELVSVNSEMSTQLERDAMSDELGCPVLDEYSSEELTRIAAQCRHGTYHLFEDINYVEVLDERGRASGSGTIVGTNLHNFAMPMIRYVQNDLGSVDAEPCPCGRRFRRLTDLQGRRNDSFTLLSGKTLSSGFLLDATYEVVLTYRSAVRDFCLIQESPDSVVLQIVPGAGWDAAVVGPMSERFTSFLEPGMRFRVEVVDSCLKTTSGKRNPIINQCR